MRVDAETTEDGHPGRYVSARKRRGATRPKIQPPLVPMIDVTFLLLLYFLLTAEFRKSEGQIAGTVPEKGEIGTEMIVPIKPIQIVIRRAWGTPDVSYEINRARVSDPEALFNRLTQRKQTLGADEIPVLIRPVGDVPWEYVIEAFNQAVRAKFLKIGFAPSG